MTACNPGRFHSTRRSGRKIGYPSVSAQNADFRFRTRPNPDSCFPDQLPISQDWTLPTDPAWGVRQWSFARLLAWKPPKPRLTWFDAAPLNFISGRPASDFQAVGGNYTGTTDMILRWRGASAAWTKINCAPGLTTKVGGARRNRLGVRTRRIIVTRLCGLRSSGRSRRGSPFAAFVLPFHGRRYRRRWRARIGASESCRCSSTDTPG